jgi:heterodisulfide reductase subunit A
MRMAVARARNLKALGTGKLPVVQSALVLGGGLAGMTTALALGDQGFAVHLCEKEAALGGQLRKIHYTLEGSDVVGFLAELIARVQNHPKITVHLQTKPRGRGRQRADHQPWCDRAGGGRFRTADRAIYERQASRRYDPTAA